MAHIVSNLAGRLSEPELSEPLQVASRALTSLVEDSAYVGEVYSLGYDEALVQIHDFHRQRVGGIPALSFLIATRVGPGALADIRQEDASIVLLRVLDKADLPNADEALRVRVETAQRVSGEVARHWDDRAVMDPTTHNLLSYAGVRCRVLGTYYMVNTGSDAAPAFRLFFGSDLSNYYPNRGLKIFKPRGRVLEAIVNFRDPRLTVSAQDGHVPVGQVRYASSHRPFQGIDGVPVQITPTDLLGQKTALFGMTRTGKSNTTKIILKSIFALRWCRNPIRIGQIVFDPMGPHGEGRGQVSHRAGLCDAGGQLDPAEYPAEHGQLVHRSSQQHGRDARNPQVLRLRGLRGQHSPRPGQRLHPRQNTVEFVRQYPCRWTGSLSKSKTPRIPRGREMPYQGEYATYRPLHRISECQRVNSLLARSKLLEAARATYAPKPVEAPPQAPALPRFILAIDGSYAEVDVKNGYPGAKVGYCTAASVLLDLHLIGELDVERPVDPVEFRKTEQAASVDAALPGSNVVTRRQNSARASFREELYDLFTDIVVDEDDRTNLLSTYQALLALKPTTNPQSCPYKESHGCTAEFAVGSGCTTCPTCGRPVYSTDALRIHERFRDIGTNGEAFGLVMQLMERLLMVHFLRCFERRNLLPRLTSLAFFIDGPLAAFGPPAWLSAAISRELKRLNQKVRVATGQDLLILGIS